LAQAIEVTSVIAGDTSPVGSHDSAIPPTSAESIRVLIVDDDPSKQSALSAALAPLGLTIVEANSGFTALRRLLEQDFAVILLDVFMPTMDGFETAALIRQRKQSEMTPIIFITAAKDEEISSVDRFTQGAVDFIFTPFDPSEIRAKVAVFANLFLTTEALASRARETQISNEHLGLVIDVAPIGIFQTDSRYKYVYTNPRWSEIIGISTASAFGRDLTAIIPPAARPDFEEQLSALSSLSEELSFRFTIDRPGLETITATMTATQIPDGQDGTRGLIGTIADVTVEALAARAMEEANVAANSASQLKSDFLANMSHEIRTPMNGVIGMTDLLLDTELSAQQRDYAQTVRNSGEALLAIINDILDFSKVEAGMLDIDNASFNMHQVANYVVSLLSTSATAKGLSLVADVAPSVPEIVRGDSGRIHQVLVNLVGNAIKFTSSGEVAIAITRVDAASMGALVHFSVMDTGIGIAADKLDSIFQPFVQADSSTSRKFGGTGLGLAISGDLISLMGGDYGVISHPQKGSTFWFTIDFEMAEFIPSGPADSVGRFGKDFFLDSSEQFQGDGGRRLLLAEDNVINRKVAVALLTNAGYVVDAVHDGLEAVDAFDGEEYAAILMDCQMPEMNGYEATAAIRVREGTGRHTPIIALTAGARSEDRDRCLREGMDGYLSKPINRETLLSVVSSFIARTPADRRSEGQG
jgi:PAS domain S-box-containing protein